MREGLRGLVARASQTAVLIHSPRVVCCVVIVWRPHAWVVLYVLRVCPLRAIVMLRCMVLLCGVIVWCYCVVLLCGVVSVVLLVRCVMWYVMWHVMCGVWCVTCGMWCVVCGSCGSCVWCAVCSAMCSVVCVVCGVIRWCGVSLSVHRGSIVN